MDRHNGRHRYNNSGNCSNNNSNIRNNNCDSGIAMHDARPSIGNSSNSSSSSSSSLSSSRRRSSLSSSTYVHSVSSLRQISYNHNTKITANDDVSTGNGWMLLDKYRGLDKHSPTAAAPPHHPASSTLSTFHSYNHRPGQCFPHHQSPSHDFPLPSPRHRSQATGYPPYSQMSVSMFGESDLLSASSPLVASTSSKSNNLVTSGCSSSMNKSAVLFQKLENDSNNYNGRRTPDVQLENGNNQRDFNLAPEARQTSALPAEGADDDELDGTLLVEQVILRRTKPNSRLVSASDGTEKQSSYYENFICSSRSKDAENSRSFALRPYRQPELRLRNSFSGRQAFANDNSSFNKSRAVFLGDPTQNYQNSRQSFHPTTDFNIATTQANNRNSVVVDMATTVENGTENGQSTTINDDLAVENSEVAEFSPEQKLAENNDNRLAMSTFVANQQQQQQQVVTHDSSGVVRQLVRRPRTFGSADVQQQKQSPVDDEKTNGVDDPSLFGGFVVSAADCLPQQPRQRVFPRTNPAFCRRNRHTTVVGQEASSSASGAMTTSGNNNEPVELLPGGIVYEPQGLHQNSNGSLSRFTNNSRVESPASSRLLATVLSASSPADAPQQQRSQTLDSRYRHHQTSTANSSSNNTNILASPGRAQHSRIIINTSSSNGSSSGNNNNGAVGTQFYVPNLPTISDVQPPYSQPLERKFSFDPTALQHHHQQQQQPQNNENILVLPSSMQTRLTPSEMTPRGPDGALTPTSGGHGSSQRSLNKDSLDSGYLPSDSQHHPSVSSSSGSHQLYNGRQSTSSATGSFRRPSTSTSSSSEPLSSSLERSPSPRRHHHQPHEQQQQQRSSRQQAQRRRPAPSSRRRHGNPPSTIFEPPASDASSDISDCAARNSNANPLTLQNMAASVAYHEGSMSDPDTLLHNMSTSLTRGGVGDSTIGSYVEAHHMMNANGMSSSAAHASAIQTPLDKSYSSQVDAIPGRPLSMLISQSEVSVGSATQHLIMSGLATGGNHRRHAHQPSSSSALFMQHHNHSGLLTSAGGSLRLTPLQLLRKAGAAGTLPGSVGCAHGVALAAALQMYARTRKPLFSDADIELYAQQFMATHRRSLFGRKLSISEMLCWTKDLIQKPMLRTTCDKAARRLCVDTFRLIQQYMGDRRTTTPSLAIAAEIVTRGWLHPNLRDEIYMQLCRQTTETPVQESLERGWELLATCLNFFPPSLHFYGYIESYVFRHTDPNYDTPKVPVSHYASYCLRQLERVVESGAKKGVKRPTIDEIDQARSSVFQPSMFGATLDDIMLVQAARFPGRRLPWIQTTLSEAVLRLNGAQTEGIFRIPGDIDEVNALKARVNQWLPPDNIRDPHVPASLLKLWYRELWTPVITPDLYSACLAAGENAQEAVQIFATLPEINRLVLAYLIRFLQVFAAPANSAVTKMDVSNLAMVFAPNVLRCSSDDPRVIFESTRREMTFLRTLIINLDTNFIEGVF